MISSNLKCHVIVNEIDYIVNVIIISDYLHDYTRCLIIYHIMHCINVKTLVIGLFVID